MKMALPTIKACYLAVLIKIQVFRINSVPGMSIPDKMWQAYNHIVRPGLDTSTVLIEHE